MIYRKDIAPQVTAHGYGPTSISIFFTGRCCNLLLSTRLPSSRALPARTLTACTIFPFFLLLFALKDARQGTACEGIGGLFLSSITSRTGTGRKLLPFFSFFLSYKSSVTDAITATFSQVFLPTFSQTFLRKRKEELEHHLLFLSLWTSSSSVFLFLSPQDLLSVRSARNASQLPCSSSLISFYRAWQLFSHAHLTHYTDARKQVTARRLILSSLLSYGPFL